MFILTVNICIPLTFFLSSFLFHRERSREHHHKSRSKDSRSEKSVTINTPPAEPLLGDSTPRGEPFQVGLDAMAFTDLSHNAFTVCHMGTSNKRWDFSATMMSWDHNQGRLGRAIWYLRAEARRAGPFLARSGLSLPGIPSLTNVCFRMWMHQVTSLLSETLLNPFCQRQAVYFSAGFVLINNLPHCTVGRSCQWPPPRWIRPSLNSLSFFLFIIFFPLSVKISIIRNHADMSEIGSSQNGLCVGLFNKREIQGRRVLTTVRNVFILGHTLLLFTGIFLPNSQSTDLFHCLVALRHVIMFLGVRLNGRTYKRQIDQIQPCQSGTLAACWHVRA